MLTWYQSQSFDTKISLMLRVWALLVSFFFFFLYSQSLSLGYNEKRADKLKRVAAAFYLVSKLPFFSTCTVSGVAPAFTVERLINAVTSCSSGQGSGEDNNSSTRWITLHHNTYLFLLKSKLHYFSWALFK